MPLDKFFVEEMHNFPGELAGKRNSIKSVSKLESGKDIPLWETMAPRLQICQYFLR